MLSINECYLVIVFKNIPVLVLSFLLLRLDRKSEPCERKNWFPHVFVYLPRARNFKSRRRNYPAAASELIPFAPTRIYVEVIRNVTIVTLARNYPAHTSELFPLGSKLVLCTDSTLRRNFSAGV